jgi:hypothetical protein
MVKENSMAVAPRKRKNPTIIYCLVAFYMLSVTARAEADFARVNMFSAPNLRTAPVHDALTQTEITVIARHIESCLSFTPGMLGQDDISIGLKVDVDSNGTIRGAQAQPGIPTDPRARAVFESVRRALLSPACRPIPIASERLHLVSQIVFRFNGRNLER